MHISTIIRYLYHLISTKLATYSAPNSSSADHLANFRRPGRRTLRREIDHKFLLRHPSTSARHGMDSLVLVSTSNRWLVGWLVGWLGGCLLVLVLVG